jgi:hypothetical protein
MIITIPALRAASDDQKRGVRRLGRPRDIGTARSSAVQGPSDVSAITDRGRKLGAADLRLKREHEDEPVRYAESVTSLIDLVGRTAYELSSRQKEKPAVQASAHRLGAVAGA